MKYLSFLSGTYSTAPGLISSQKVEGSERLIFQIDDQYGHYINNKKSCRSEDITKYYCEHNLRAVTVRTVNRYIAAQLLADYPDQFEGEANESHLQLKNRITNEDIASSDWRTTAAPYHSLFDALCSQVQEDVAVVQWGDPDFIAALHLCAPNHWSPHDKIGKPFHSVHAPVPAMERTVQHYHKMMASIVSSSSPSMRFAWGIATDDRLNHHPEPPPGTESYFWNGRLHDQSSTWYVRSERQTLVGFPEANALMFTIRTYHYPVEELTAFEKQQLLSALRSMTPASLQYKGIAGSLHLLEEKLQGQ